MQLKLLKAEVFALLDAAILAGKQATGRTSMALWQILVLGVVRLAIERAETLGIALKTSPTITR